MSFSIILIVIIILLISLSIKIVSKNEVHVIERFGKYHKTRTNCVYFKIPFIDHLAARYDITNLDVELTCSSIEINNHEIINLKVYVTLKINDYYKYTYTQAPKQFENLIYDELSQLCLKYPLIKVESSLKEIEYKLYKIIESSPIMHNIGLSCLELTIKMNEKTNF